MELALLCGMLVMAGKLGENTPRGRRKDAGKLYTLLPRLGCSDPQSPGPSVSIRGSKIVTSAGEL
jgi:hypothetical protein